MGRVSDYNMNGNRLIREHLRRKVDRSMGRLVKSSDGTMVRVMTETSYRDGQVRGSVERLGYCDGLFGVSDDFGYCDA